MALIFTLDDLPAALSASRASGQVIVATNGCFDLLHAGHVRYLQQAKALGHLLIVGVNSDASVRSLKGASRPLNSLDDRMAVLAALTVVDAVCSFEEQTAEAFLRACRPSIYVKGGEYESGKLLPESDCLAEMGAQVRFIPMLAGRSTTALIDKASENR
ncbi:MAG: adenylyltransferase/cytidyltransferase family protein [Vampirovibrionales bacterium]|nr:adenylyltransferase/cytidyltransferase family protein [Vampirovibrionales bacterium]